MLEVQEAALASLIKSHPEPEAMRAYWRSACSILIANHTSAALGDPMLSYFSEQVKESIGILDQAFDIAKGS